MAAPKRLVLFVEGQGDANAVPILVKALLTEYNAWDCLFLDPALLRVGQVTDLIGRNKHNWVRYLEIAKKRPYLGGVLLLLDGDIEPAKGKEFCAAEIGWDLSKEARQTGAGTLFSVASVFAVKEFETWLIAGVETLAGKRLPDGRTGIHADTKAPAGDVEQAPRDAKKWLNDHMESGYKPTSDQESLTRLLVSDLNATRNRGLRSFRHLETALQQLVSGIRSGPHMVTPEPPSS